MPKTREELLKLLEGVEGGADYLACLTAIEDGYKAEITKRNNEAKNLRDRAKDAEGKLTGVTEKFGKVAEFLGVDPESGDDLDETLAGLDKSAKNGAELAKRLELANAKIKKLESDHATALKAETGKRHDLMKRGAVIEALTKAGAADPSAIYEIFAGKVTIGEDDSLTATDDKGNNVGVEDFAKGWLTAHPWAAKNPQAGGAGGGAGGGGKADEAGKFGAELAKSLAPTQTEGHSYFK